MLEDAVAGCEIIVPRHGAAFHIATALDDLDGDWMPLRRAFPRAFFPDTALQRRLGARLDVVNFTHDDVIFVDVETTGLSDSPLFLIGTMAWEGDDLVVRQYLARHYGEESAVTALFLDRASEKRLLVSFNGKSFDYPYIRTRAVANGVPFALELAHFDLLHECRRVWRGTLPNCKLQTLEQHVCGHPPRSGDIPGHAIPDAYHTYVRTSNAGQLVQIIKHNLLDLVTLAELMTKLPA